MANRTIEDTLLYFHGEAKNPYKANEIGYLYWELEYSYIHNCKGTILEDEYLSNFTFDFPDLLDDVSKSVTTAVKSFLYDQYCHVGGSKGGFPVWFNAYVYGK